LRLIVAHEGTVKVGNDENLLQIPAVEVVRFRMQDLGFRR
jgi:hypothetical protein